MMGCPLVARTVFLMPCSIYESVQMEGVQHPLMLKDLVLAASAKIQLRLLLRLPPPLLPPPTDFVESNTPCLSGENLDSQACQGLAIDTGANWYTPGNIGGHCMKFETGTTISYMHGGAGNPVCGSGTNVGAICICYGNTPRTPPPSPAPLPYYQLELNQECATGQELDQAACEMIANQEKCQLLCV